MIGLKQLWDTKECKKQIEQNETNLEVSFETIIEETDLLVDFIIDNQDGIDDFQKLYLENLIISFFKYININELEEENKELEFLLAQRLIENGFHSNSLTRKNLILLFRSAFIQRELLESDESAKVERLVLQYKSAICLSLLGGEIEKEVDLIKVINDHYKGVHKKQVHL